jgi:hypothetical protein
MVVVDDLRNIERSQWEVLTLNHMARPLASLPVVQEATPLAEVIAQLEDQALAQLTVLSPADAVAGILDRGDVVRALADRLQLRIPPTVIQRIKEDGQYPAGLQLANLARSVSQDNQILKPRVAQTQP